MFTAMSKQKRVYVMDEQQINLDCETVESEKCTCLSRNLLPAHCPVFSSYWLHLNLDFNSRRFGHLLLKKGSEFVFQSYFIISN